MVPVLFPLPGEPSQAGSPVEHHGRIMLAVPLAISRPVVFSCSVSCSRCEPSTCCSLLYQGMCLVDPLNRFFVLMLLGRVPRWPCSSKEWRDHRSVLLSSLYGCFAGRDGFMGGS